MNDMMYIVHYGARERTFIGTEGYKNFKDNEFKLRTFYFNRCLPRNANRLFGIFYFEVGLALISKVVKSIESAFIRSLSI